MSIYISTKEQMYLGKIKTFEQYIKGFKKDYREIDLEIGIMDSNELIELLQKLQTEYNTSDLRVTSKVTDSYYEQSDIVILRPETGREFRDRVMYRYNLDKKQHDKAVENDRKRKQIDELKKQQDKLQTKIEELCA